MNNNSSNSGVGFPGLGVAPVLLQALERMKISIPTPIQLQAIPQALEGKDIAGVAQTGTGKTIAFGIPMIQRLGIVNGSGLVVLPTRELAQQVDESIRKLGEGIGIRTAVLIGGTSMGPQVQALRRNPHIVIGTPGRINDLLFQRYLRLDDVKVVVLDEADRMLDMGFAPQIEKIFKALSKDRQTMLFSATMPDGIMRLASAYMKMPIRIEVAPTGTLAQGVTQELFVIHKEQRARLLDKLLQQYPGTTLIFTRTKHGAHKLANTIRGMGHTAAEMHANRSQSQRREALDGFKKGKYRILTATDIASRGIDVNGIALVLNYDLPTNPEDYVHRIGRTARAGAGGHAISFVAPEQRGEVRGIERLIRKTLTISKLPDLPPARIVHNNTAYHQPQRPADNPGHRPASGNQNPDNRRRSAYPRAQNRFRN